VKGHGKWVKREAKERIKKHPTLYPITGQETMAKGEREKDHKDESDLDNQIDGSLRGIIRCG